MSAIRFKARSWGYRWEDDNGFVYKQKKLLKSGSIYVTCVNKQCSGTCKIKSEVDSNRGKYHLIRKHLPDSACIDISNRARVEALRNVIIDRANKENTPNSIIFQEEIDKAPVELRNVLNFTTLERSMQRSHVPTNPGKVDNFEEFDIQIREWYGRFGEINNQQFFLGRFGEGTMSGT
ncbi:uncharacterized protein LOC120354391 [Nilaparvata lugens]|uniref:uncharacterized protein LOC120354391 n=1 Tax=Nilaparvata lugens TaxID=108931 RepID=UPI00193E43D0|nr:uncharacterized protein LOC120354391 [Nilaparvata lugens]